MSEELEKITEDTLRTLWKPLDVSDDFFNNCKKHAINYILAENYERKYYFFGCENIEFQNEKGEKIWSTTGNGEVNLPARVGVYIVRGKIRSG
ncbi:hypothetical protein NPX13_g10361 [Xylaria arbuscula]|uniref:Uncharacterized protein n=1 Tax=Xylaria arbuscula TaxID=114810 RepID=A0A9W8N4Y4_9PEZI|nr:hypothetical protein NPX13_g10361 [Xylaria arbuscula]